MLITAVMTVMTAQEFLTETLQQTTAVPATTIHLTIAFRTVLVTGAVMQ